MEKLLDYIANEITRGGPTSDREFISMFLHHALRNAATTRTRETDFLMCSLDAKGLIPKDIQGLSVTAPEGGK